MRHAHTWRFTLCSVLTAGLLLPPVLSPCLVVTARARTIPPPPLSASSTSAAALTAGLDSPTPTVTVTPLPTETPTPTWGVGSPQPTPTPTTTPTPSPTSAVPPAPHTWIFTGALTAGRFGQTATLLQNGKVLVAGGEANSTDLASAELYDPRTGVWTSTGSMIAPRADHTATLLQNGEVLVAGGENTLDHLPSAELYNPRTGIWSATGAMLTTRIHHTASLLPDGRVLVVGGYGPPDQGIWGILNSAEIYDPRTGTWSATTGMHTFREYHTATLLPDGRVLVAGGTSFQDTSGTIFIAISEAELYDPRTATWTQTGSLTSARTEHTATLLPDGRVLVVGGTSVANSGDEYTLASAELYDPRTGTWTPTGSLATPRFEHTTTLLADGTVLVAGGCCDASQLALSDAEVYHPRTGLWTTTAPLEDGRYLHTATRLPDGQVLVAGGYRSWLTTPTGLLSSAERYVVPSIVVSPTHGIVGAPLTIAGTSFAAHEPVAIHWDSASSAALAVVVASAHGALGAKVRMPLATAGRHLLIAVGQISRAAAVAVVQVRPSLVLVPSAGAAGTTVRALGCGFGPQEQVTLAWDRLDDPLGATTTDGRGCFGLSIPVAITVPLTATAGVHALLGLGHTTHAVGASDFTVQ